MERVQIKDCGAVLTAVDTLKIIYLLFDIENV